MRSEKTNYTFKYFIYQLGRLKGIIIFATIFSMLFFPCIFLEYGALESNLEFQSAILAILSFFGLIAVALIAPLKAMNHLYTKTSADNILSLPLTASQRFIADICAGFGAFAVPFAVSIPVSFAVRTIFNSSINFDYVFLAFFLLLMFAAFNTLFITCCGRKTEAILYPIALNIAVPLFTILGTFISYYNSYGLSSIYSDSAVGFEQALDGFLGYFAGVTSPLGAFFLAFIKPVRIPIIVAAVMTIVFLAISFVLYIKRPAQRIGQSFVFKPVFIITTIFISISAIITYISFSLEFSYVDDFDFGSNIFAVAVVVFILMLVMEFINGKRIKSILKFLLKYAAATIGGLLLCFMLYSSEGFGIVSYIPADDSIEYIDIYNFNSLNAYFYNDQACVRGGTDAAELISDFHSDRVENRIENDYNSGIIYITYNLKNGQKVQRTYVDGGDEFWNAVYQSEGYRLNEINTLLLKTKNWKTVDPIYTVAFTNEHNNKICYALAANIPFPTELVNALEKDLAADSMYGRHTDAAIGILRFGTDYDEDSGKEYMDFNTIDTGSDIRIYESYTNTIAYLNTIGRVPTAQEAASDSSDSAMYYSIVKCPHDKSPSFEDIEMILITKYEYEELLTSEVKHNYTTDKEYSYYLFLGIEYAFAPSPYQNYSNVSISEQYEAFRRAGIPDPEYAFGTLMYGSTVNIDTSYPSALLNEEIYDKLDELFSVRTVINAVTE